ncbi:5-formyltetrahydrofolate cyclo-ligase protein [Candidatus Micropelagos thuwalensis]|uniref:5-formyltetrahydrofolate cyclo-ligase protein n=1 Tax=Candidatus Micropelagius thuwalensis TaxID=1397666 RepID=U2XM39_9PROT|nr:haloalkane dehalogenase [Candidatus Micropelagos thuwalensis]ERL46182.1 5-formyltetrahydrofolate cyclo-ligase protein [Candidatus Micropelagos thuwalensis]
MKVLRTPDSQFENLLDYDFPPTYTTIQDVDGTHIRIHSVDVGPKDADPILLMHGNPTWSYLYRHMIKALEKTGRRVIALDLVGCGRSDKPAKRKYYTLARHHDWYCKWLETNNLDNITLVCHDWGGTLGLKLVAKYPERFARVFATNTGLPTGQGGSKLLKWWLRLMKFAIAFPWNAFEANFVKTKPTHDEMKAFKAPFPSRKYQAGIVKFPQLIAIFPDNPGVPANREAWAKLASFDKPFLTVFGNKDPVTRKIEKRLIDHIPGCRKQSHTILDGIGHFSPEEAPDALLEHLIPFLDT